MAKSSKKISDDISKKIIAKVISEGGNISYHELAKEFKICVSTIYRILKDNNIKKPNKKSERVKKINDELISKILNFVKDNNFTGTYTNIANHFNISVSVTYNILRNNNIKIIQNKTNAEASAEIVYENNEKVNEIKELIRKGKYWDHYPVSKMFG